MFAAHYSLKRPHETFLRKCTNEDNWLVFVIFAQIYEIPKEDLQQFLSQTNFNNQCIGEHLIKAFQSSRHVNVASTTTAMNETESRLLRSKQTPESSRNVLYSKLFKEKSVPIGSPPPQTASQSLPDNSTGIESDSAENLSMLSSSMFSSKLSGDDMKRSNVSRVLFESRLQPSTASKCFLQLI
ncbi:spatacsin-like protein, partial [Euroglyphus maynei]